MKRKRQFGVGAIATLAVVGATMGVGLSAAAHGPQGSPGYGGPGMMGPGMMGPGMMGPGAGYGGPGMMNPYMGQGMGPGMMGYAPGQRGGWQGQMQALPQDLSADQARHMLEHQLSMQGNPNLEVGKVEEKDQDTITAQIVTKDGSLVRELEINRHTGWMQPAR